MYIDVYFLINLVLDRCSLECALKKYPLSRGRMWVGAVVGAMGACLWEISGFPISVRPVWALLLSFLMIFVCIGKRPLNQWGEAMIRVYGFGFLFAGVIPYVSRFMPVWIGSVLISYAGIRLWLKWQEKKTGDMVDVRVETEKGSWKGRAMIDTGHTLRDSITGRPVVIVKKGVLPEEIPLSWPVCFKSVQGKGVMFGVWPKGVTIGDRLYKEREILVAVAEEWKDADCEALIPGYILK